MGRLDKLFGGGRKKQPEETWQEREAKRQVERDKDAERMLRESTERFDAAMVQNEAPIPQRTQSEGVESPRAIKCYQFKHGKSVQHKDGPIERGVDYHTTAAPSDPQIRKLNSAMHPSQFPFGTDDLTNWTNIKSKPLARVIRTIDGAPYVVCGQIEGRSESGTGKSGRPYVESHYIAVPASEWSIALVPQLSSILSTEPHVVGDSNILPEIEVRTNLLDETLSEDWFDEMTKETLTRLASGQSVSFQNNMDQEKFLQNIFYCLLCLPEDAARRISFGAGIGNRKIWPEGAVGLRAFQGSTGFSGRPLKMLERAWMYDDKQKMHLGEEYVSALLPLLASVRTPREVMRAVQQLPKELVENVSKRMYP